MRPLPCGRHVKRVESRHGSLLLDQPIMVQSLADRSSIEDEAKLRELLMFCKRMGRQTNQASVMLIFNDVRHYIEDFKD